MKVFMIFILFFQFNLYAGGTDFRIKVINFKKVTDEKYIFVFKQIDPSYESKPIKNLIRLTIRFKCSQSFFTCLLKKRTFSKKQHIEALKYLQKIATPGKIIRFGIMGGGFLKYNNSPNEYYCNGLFLESGTVYAYTNSHL